MPNEWMSEDTISTESQLDQRLIHALETRPTIVIPADFAARVASRMPPRKTPSLTPRHYGRNVIAACIVALALAMLALAMNKAEHTTFGLALQWILCAQFLALVFWFGVKLQKLRD